MPSPDYVAASTVDASNSLRFTPFLRLTSPWSIFILAITFAILLRHGTSKNRASGDDKKAGKHSHCLAVIPGPKRESEYILHNSDHAMVTNRLQSNKRMPEKC